MTECAAPDDPDLVRFLREELGAGVDAGGDWRFTGPIWLWRGTGKDGAPTATAWHFITIDGAVADAIRAAAPGRTAAWGSVKVRATIGVTEWRTSVFPSKNVDGYLLPVKASVRKAEGVGDGHIVAVRLEV